MTDKEIAREVQRLSLILDVVEDRLGDLLSKTKEYKDHYLIEQAHGSVSDALNDMCLIV